VHRTAYLPYRLDCTFGDGSPITAGEMDQVRGARKVTVCWAKTSARSAIS
jgi:hypothetical protein